MSSPSASRVSSSLNRLPSSPRSNSNVQPGYLKSGSPPGASITPSSDTNSVTTISAGTWSPRLEVCGYVPSDRGGRGNSSPRISSTLGCSAMTSSLEGACSTTSSLDGACSSTSSGAGLSTSGRFGSVGSLMGWCYPREHLLCRPAPATIVTSTLADPRGLRMTTPTSPQTDFDVLIVGAGLSGIGAAYYLSRFAPSRSFAIVEGRDAIGGTW